MTVDQKTHTRHVEIQLRLERKKNERERAEILSINLEIERLRQFLDDERRRTDELTDRIEHIRREEVDRWKAHTQRAEQEIERLQALYRWRPVSEPPENGQWCLVWAPRSLGNFTHKSAPPVLKAQWDKAARVFETTETEAYETCLMEIPVEDADRWMPIPMPEGPIR
jgi:septal ring factor EnvC (AmiA/AmiB activator)